MLRAAPARPWVWGVLGLFLGVSLALLTSNSSRGGHLARLTRTRGATSVEEDSVRRLSDPPMQALALGKQASEAHGNPVPQAGGVPRQLSPQHAGGSWDLADAADEDAVLAIPTKDGLQQEQVRVSGRLWTGEGQADAPAHAVWGPDVRAGEEHVALLPSGGGEEEDLEDPWDGLPAAGGAGGLQRPAGQPAGSAGSSVGGAELPLAAWDAPAAEAGDGGLPSQAGAASKSREEEEAEAEAEALRQQLLDRIHALSAPAPSTAQLFARIDADLEPFEVLGNITEAMVDQAYCTSNEQGFRFQIIDGRLYVVGMVESFQTRLLNIQRQLWAASQRWDLPDVDMMIEQGDWPTTGPLTEECPERGPIIAPAKHCLDPAHMHVLLAPDHTFGEWIEVMTPSWGEMQTLLEQAAEDHPWDERAPTIFFRGAPTGPTRAELAASMHHWAAAHNWHIDVAIAEDIHTPANFKSIYQHCSHKYLLHLPGNTYSGRLKYLMGCGAAIVWLGARETNLTSAYHEFWYHLLRDQEHLLFVETGKEGEKNMAAELAAAVQVLLHNDTHARHMGQAARELIHALLTPETAQEYWARLITRYAALQNFQPRLHPDAVPIEESMVSRRFIPRERRSCPRCRPQPPNP